MKRHSENLSFDQVHYTEIEFGIGNKRRESKKSLKILDTKRRLERETSGVSTCIEAREANLAFQLFFLPILLYWALVRDKTNFIS